MILDNQNIYKKLDPKEVNKSIELLGDQVRHVLEISPIIKIPKSFTKCHRVVISGMGGSNLGGHILRSALSDQAKIPIIINPGYIVPNYVDKNTLYLISSYSGTTEEPLSTYKEAKKRGAKIIGITSKGKKNKLEKLMMREDLPGLIFEDRFNPSNQPRIALGYSIFGMMVLLAKSAVLTIKTKEIKDIIDFLEIETRRLRTDVSSKTNKAKQIAWELRGKIPVLVSAEHLIGNLHAMRNQINENAKTYSDYLELPDLNHHALEGLQNPKTVEKLKYLFFSSKLFHPRIQKRLKLTETVVKKNKVSALTHELKGKTKLAQSFELLQLGTWISYYLGEIYKVDPIEIPWVDWFKKQLK